MRLSTKKLLVAALSAGTLSRADRPEVEYLGLTMDDEQVSVRVTRSPVVAERSQRPVGA